MACFHEEKRWLCSIQPFDSMQGAEKLHLVLANKWVVSNQTLLRRQPLRMSCSNTGRPEIRILAMWFREMEQRTSDELTSQLVQRHLEVTALV